MMPELVPCPVCTLFLHKGMSLAEHLDTHPKEQVIRALVSLASISPESPLTTQSLSATSSTGTTTGTITISKSSLPPPPLIPPPVLQSLIPCSGTTTENSQLNSNTISVSSIATTPSTSTAATTTATSAVSGITTFGKCNNNNSTKNVDRHQQQNFTVGNRPNELFYQITSDGQTGHPVINYNNNNNNNNQHLNSQQQTHLQDFFNYQNKATKKLPPPPTYGTAISQLRSQNNQSNNYARTQSMTLNYQSSALNNYGGGNGFSSNNHNNIRHNQETLDYSLPKQQQQPAHPTTNLLSPRHIKSQYSTAATAAPTTSQLKVQQQQSTLSTYFTSPASSSSSSTSSSSSGHSFNQQQQQQLIKTHSHRTPSPQNLSLSPRQPQSPSSVLRYAESPISVQYIERDNGDFLVQESPRHIVQCFEKDDGQFSVIEKVIRSPPALVQIDEFVENDNQSLLINENCNNNNNNNLENVSKIENTEKDENLNEEENHIIKSELNSNNVDPNTSTNSSAKKQIKKIEIYSDDDDDDDDNNHDDDIIIIKDESPPKRNNPNGIKVLSNVKLDPNESLDIMENINKTGVRNCSEHFFQSIVQSIKKEEDMKISNINNITSPSKIIIDNDIDNNLNLKLIKKTNSIDNEIPIISSCTNITASTSTNSIGTTSVIRLAGQKDDLNKISNNIIPTCTVDLTIKPSTSCRSNDNIKPYKKHPKKLIVKFKNPIIPTKINTESTNKISNNITEIINLDEPSESVLNTDKISIVDNKNINELNESPINESNNNNDKSDDKINIILDINETVFSVTEITENDHNYDDDDYNDCKMDIECYNITDHNNITTTSSSGKIEKIDNSNNLNIINNHNNDGSMEIETELKNCTNNNNNNKNDKLIENLNKIETIAVVIEIPENKESLRSSIKNDRNCEPINSFILNSSSASPISNKSSINELCSKPSTSSFLSQNDIQQQNQQSSISNNYNDYPFSFLYTAATTGIHNNNNIIGSNSINTTIEIQQNNNNQICTSNLSLSYHQNSETATDLFQQHHYNNNGGAIFQSTSNTNHVNDLEDEKSSYLDLDACSNSKPITSCCSATTSCNSSNGIGGILSNHDHIPLVDALNIRTDEKMPAKGEISEQESNGDIENSWSQPLYTELAYKFPNPYDHFVSRESWSLSHDEFFVPHDLSTSGRTKFIPEKSLQQQQIPILSEVTSTISSSTVPKKKSNKKSNVTTTTITASTTVVAESSNQRTSSTSSSSVVPAVKRKIFKCEHCGIIFYRLKDRNSHLMDQHQYKRVNRRLVRELPSSTVTSASIIINQSEILTEPKLEPIDSTTTLITNILDNGNLIKIENSDDLMNEIQQTTTIDNQIDSTEDKKPILPVVSTKIEPTNFPRTKYDSIRANVYRMLMNFNLSVLQQKGGIDVEEKKVFESKSFCCYTCKRDFISVKLYDEHLAEHAAECFTCNKKFSRWTYFSLHLKRHLGWKDFWCTQCDKKFVIRSALIEHIRTHTGIAPLKCNLCSKSFKRYSNLTQHKKICHSKKPIRTKEYVCYCGEVLPSKARYLWHKEIHDPKPKCCPWCRDRFVHANSLRRHIRLMHSDKFSYSEPVECTICNQVYAKSSLKSHMTTHSMDTQHECPICNKSFSTKWNLKIHSWVHANRTAKPFKCEHCTKAFVREIDYKNHMNSHKQIRPYTCEYCGCKFIRKYNYMRHRREHHGQKKFSCDLCSKLFHRHYYLIEHRRIHTGERPFLCTICGKSSTTKTNHNKHLKIHHSRDPFTSES